MSKGEAIPGEWARGLASDLAPGLLQKVIEQSQDDAADILRASLTAALVEEVERRLANTIPQQAEELASQNYPCSPEADEQPQPGVYVYGITWSATALTKTTGVAGGPVQKVVVGDLAAVVTPIVQSAPWGLDGEGELDLVALAPRVQEHADVLEDALEQGAVLPLRFGVMYPDADAVEDALRRQEAALQATLRRLENQGQWDLVLEWPGVASAAHPSAVSSAGGRPTAVTGRGYLSSRADENIAQQETGQRARAAAMAVHDELVAFASDAILQPIPRTRGDEIHRLLKASYLVPAERAEAFRNAADAALVRADGDLGIEGELTGPWPPYNFSELLEERFA